MKQLFDICITSGGIKLKCPAEWHGGRKEFVELREMAESYADVLRDLPGSKTWLPNIHGQKTKNDVLMSAAVIGATHPSSMNSELPMLIIMYCILNSPTPGYGGTYADRLEDHSFHFKVTINGSGADIKATCITSPVPH